jgi:hypothetical protein
MSIQLPVVNAAANDTFQHLIDKTNAIINTVANSVITANTNANGATTTGNAYVSGIFGATTITTSALRGGNVQSSANLLISSNALFTGDILMLGSNITLNTSSLSLGANVSLTNSRASLGNSTVNAVLNSTALALSANMVLLGTGLFFGNSTVNAVVNTSGLSISGVAIPTADTRDAVAVDGALIGTGSRINFSGAGAANVAATVDVGNNQINVVITSTVSLGNGVGGSNTNILFNDSTAMGGTAALTFDKNGNNLFVANGATIGNTTINSTSWFMGNSIVNAVTNSTSRTMSNSTVATTYELGGWNIGANVTGNLTAILVGTTLINSTTLSAASLLYSSQISGGNVVLSTSRLAIGNSTINSVVNSTAVVVGGATVNGSAVIIGANLVVNTSFFLLGNSTVSWSGNSVQVQVANSTVATIANSNGLAVGSNVSVSYQAVTVGNTVINSTSITAASYLGAGISNTLNFYANTAGKVVTTDVLNNSGAFITLTDAATIAVDMATGINFQVTLGGNRTLGNPTNVVVGRAGVMRVIEDGTGGRTLSFGSNYVFDSNTAPSLSTTANKENYLSYFAVTATRILVTLAAKAV